VEEKELANTEEKQSYAEIAGADKSVVTDDKNTCVETATRTDVHQKSALTTNADRDARNAEEEAFVDMVSEESFVLNARIRVFLCQLWQLKTEFHVPNSGASE
jgi:hypothetical protein